MARAVSKEVAVGAGGHPGLEALQVEHGGFGAASRTSCGGADFSDLGRLDFCVRAAGNGMIFFPGMGDVLTAKEKPHSQEWLCHNSGWATMALQSVQPALRPFLRSSALAGTARSRVFPARRDVCCSTLCFSAATRSITGACFLCGTAATDLPCVLASIRF